MEYLLLLLALIILGFVVWKTGLHNMILDLLDGHAAKVRAELDEAKKLREEGQKLLADHQSKLAGGEEHAKKIAEQAEAETKRMIERHKADLAASLKRREDQAMTRIAQAEAKGAAGGQKPHGRSRDPHHGSPARRQDGRRSGQVPARRRDRGGQPQAGLGQGPRRGRRTPPGG